jgi:phosphate transport system protein
VADHTVKAYDREFDALADRIAGMGGIAEKMVFDAVEALAGADTVLAYQVAATDVSLNVLQREIEELAVIAIARHQPVAIDLRELIGVMRVAGDLERIGDLARNIAERTVEIGAELRFPNAIIGLKRMNTVAAGLVKDALDAYAQRDAERAQKVWERDDDLDALDEGFSRQVLTHMMEDPRHISLCTHLLFCSKNIERIGDHATNIAETAVYVATGESMPAERPRAPKKERGRGAGGGEAGTAAPGER